MFGLGVLLKWKMPLACQSVTNPLSSPAVVNGVVYFGCSNSLQDDPHDPDLDDLAPEMSASLLHLSFRIMGTADLLLTAKVLLHYYGADTSEERKRPFLVKPDSSWSK